MYVCVYVCLSVGLYVCLSLCVYMYKLAIRANETDRWTRSRVELSHRPGARSFKGLTPYANASANNSKEKSRPLELVSKIIS